MIRMLFGLVEGLLDVYKLLIVAYCIISIMGMNANKWTEMLRSIIEPLLAPIRKVIHQYVPRKWCVIDWSPAVLFLLVCVVQWLL